MACETSNDKCIAMGVAAGCIAQICSNHLNIVLFWRKTMTLQRVFLRIGKLVCNSNGPTITLCRNYDTCIDQYIYCYIII